VVYHGFNHNIYRPEGKQEDIVLTIGIISWGTMKKKGIETFVKAAKYLKNIRFVLIGDYQDDCINYLKSIASSNVKFTGYIPFSDLLDYMKKAKVYVQVSAHESFSSSLAEAMLCECVPVVTRRAALPEVVGNVGYYVQYDNPEQTAIAIKNAMISGKGKLARCRIIDNFDISFRQNSIQKIIDSLYS
jgi:glycosyltransferase involved in cell wall biosynthesis